SPRARRHRAADSERRGADAAGLLRGASAAAIDRTMTVLRWIERTLLAAGIALAIWCAVVMIEATYAQHMPVPPPPLTITQTLPGDAGSARVPPAAGTWLARLDAPAVEMTTTVLEGSDDGTLRRAAGHIEDTSLPGQRGNVGIAGHRDTVFRPLRRMKVGDA